MTEASRHHSFRRPQALRRRARAGRHRPGERRAAFLVLHGFGSNKTSSNVLQPTKVLNELGYVTLRFDMRGCGDSEGERGRVICLEQVEDTRNALTFLAKHPAVDPDRIGVIGSSFGGAVAVYAGGVDERVAAVISNGGWGDGERKFRGQHKSPRGMGALHQHARGGPRAPRQDRQVADGAALRHRADPAAPAQQPRQPTRFIRSRPRPRRACTTSAPTTWSARSRRGRCCCCTPPNDSVTPDRAVDRAVQARRPADRAAPHQRCRSFHVRREQRARLGPAARLARRLFSDHRRRASHAAE